MRWLLSFLAVLVLIEAGLGVCPSAHAAEPQAHGVEHGAHTSTSEACHDSEEASSGLADPEPYACCGGGAACGDCALLTVTLTSATAEPAPPAPGLIRVFTPVAAPALVFAFDPPPPRRAQL